MPRARRRRCRRVDVIALREVLGSLDNAHGELVYSMLYLRYVQTGVFEQIDFAKGKKYRKLCYCLFKMTGQMLPALADYTCVLLAGLANKEIAATRRHTDYDEAEKMIWRLSMRHLRKARTTPLAAFLNSTYSRHLPEFDLEKAISSVKSVVRETARLVSIKEYHLAVGNFTVLFRVLHKLFVWYPEKFSEASLDAGCSLEDMREITRILFCKMRGTEGLPDDIAEELDCIAVVKNARYNNFLGDWDSEEFRDMVSGTGQQSHDYVLEEAWTTPEPLQLNEISIAR